MDLDHGELEKYLYKIFTGIDFVYIKSVDENIMFNQPTNVDKMKANFIYDESYNKAVSEGMLPIKDLEDLITKRGFFTDKDQEKVDNLQSKLYAQEVLLGKTTKVKANADRIKDVINKLNNEINAITYKKNSKLFMSAENKAEEDKTLYLCSVCARTYDGELCWKTYKNILKETNITFKNEVLMGFMKFYVGLSSEVIRAIARSNLWRIRYVNSQKTSDPLLGVPASDYTNDQLHLVYWSNYYQNIYEMLPEDRPQDTIIEDDAALDAYMKSYYDEKTKEDAARKSKHSVGGDLSSFDKKEVIVTQANELYEDIKYDKPREAQRIKDRNEIKKKAKKRRR